MSRRTHIKELDPSTRNGHKNYYEVCGSIGSTNEDLESHIIEVIACFHGNEGPSTEMIISDIGTHFHVNFGIEKTEDLRNALNIALDKFKSYELEQQEDQISRTG